MSDFVGPHRSGTTHTADSPVYETGNPESAELAFKEIKDSLTEYQIWAIMAWRDIKMRYRGSALGPFWLTASMGITILALGGLYGLLFKIDLKIFFPFLTLGLLTWTLISTTIIDTCTGFISAEQIIKQVRLPIPVHILRVIARNFIIFGHNFVVYIIVAIVFQINPGFEVLLVIPGLLIIALNAAWSGLMLGMVCARFRDVVQIVSSMVQLAFFVTPIIWMPGLVKERIIFVNFNPFYHFVELVRMPLGGTIPSLLTYSVALGITAAGWVCCFLMFQKYRTRIAFWV